MAEAVSWQAGAMRRVVREGRKGCERAAEDSEVGARLGEAGSGVEGDIGCGEDIGRPLAVEVEELRVAGVGCF